MLLITIVQLKNLDKRTKSMTVLSCFVKDLNVKRKYS